MTRWLALAMLSVMMLAGCARSPEVSGIGPHVDPETAVKLAREKTPLTEVSKVEGSDGLPFRHVIRGRDKEGRELIVWVSTDITKQIYVDQMLTQAQALEVAAGNGIPGAEVKTVHVGHMMGRGDPVYWYFSTGCKWIRVDAVTGEVLQTGVYGCN